MEIACDINFYFSFICLNDTLITHNNTKKSSTNKMCIFLNNTFMYSILLFQNFASTSQFCVMTSLKFDHFGGIQKHHETCAPIAILLCHSFAVEVPVKQLIRARFASLYLATILVAIFDQYIFHHLS